jgi:ribonuclease E
MAQRAQAEPGHTDASGEAVEGQRQPRERRSRDRYGRDRRERGEGSERTDRPARADTAEAGGPDGESRPAAEAFVPNEAQAQETRAQPAMNIIAPAAAPAFVQPAPARSMQAAPAPVATQAPAPATPATALPKVQSYDLPLQDLVQVAEASGLQWVNSDADKIAQAKAALDNEEKPAHVPRERAELAVSDDGPLVLVETKRDLRDMSLPFERPSA